MLEQGSDTIGHSGILELTSRHSEGLFGDVIVRNAFLYPDREAYVYGDQRLTFKQVNKRVNSLIHALLQKGLEKGEGSSGPCRCG